MEFWFFVLAFLAEIVGTIAGFGSSTILLPLAVLFFDFKTSLVLVAFVHFFGDLGRIAFFRKGLEWRVIFYFGVLGIVGTVLGALLVSFLDQNILKAMLGVFLIGYSLFSLFRHMIKAKPTKLNMILGGSVSGFVAGLIGTGGAIRSAFLLAYSLPKARYIGTAAAIAMLADASRITIYLKEGLLTESYLWMLPILFVLAIAGSYIGKRLVNKIPQAIFSRIILLALLLIGIKFLADYVV